MINQLEEECWNLDYHLAKSILPKLLYFKNWVDKYGCPTDLEMDEWNEIVDEMIWAFTYVYNEYPRTTDFVVKDTNIEFGERTQDGFISSVITLIYKEGFTEEDYLRAQSKDESNVARCQQGLNLFSKYFMSLWN